MENKISDRQFWECAGKLSEGRHLTQKTVEDPPGRPQQRAAEGTGETGLGSERPDLWKTDLYPGTY